MGAVKTDEDGWLNCQWLGELKSVSIGSRTSQARPHGATLQHENEQPSDPSRGALGDAVHSQLPRGYAPARRPTGAHTRPRPPDS